jgi:hypothetical protein
MTSGRLRLPARDGTSVAKIQWGDCGSGRFQGEAWGVGTCLHFRLKGGITKLRAKGMGSDLLIISDNLLKN